MSLGFGFSLPTLGWHLSGGGASSGYSVTKSLRFRASASAYLNRTPPAGNRQTWTWSNWVKRGQLGLGSQASFFTTWNASNQYNDIGFNVNDVFHFFNNTSGAVTALYTTAVYRDPAAWYHIILAVDTTQATASDRVKIYINGVQITSFGTATYPSQNSSLQINSAIQHNIGYGQDGGGYFDGEMAEINFVDGYPTGVTSGTWAATNIASSFGAYSIYNQWLPIAYAGVYGTNGFYLPFSGGTATSYAGSFNGSSQYLTVPNDTAFTLGATSTTEAWIYVTSTTNNKRIITNGSNTNSFDFGLYNSTNTVFVAGGNANTTASIPLNTWTHVAVVFNSGTLTIYFNGVSQALSGVTTGYSLVASTLSAVFIGAQNAGSYFPGYISNLRVVKGTAVYTANFVPPTTALTAITNTSLLTLQNATIVDNSTNAFTITNTGTVVTSVQSPFLNPTVLTADSSGNANNWTPNNISLTAGSTYDSLTDVPTLTSETVANYAVLLQIASTMGGQSTITDGNLNYLSPNPSSNYASSGVRASIPFASGKFYWEALITLTPGVNGGYYIGVTDTAASLNTGGGFDNGYLWGYNVLTGAVYVNGTSVTTVATSTLNDIIGLAYDRTAGTMSVYKNNTLLSTQTGTPSGAGGAWVPSMTIDQGYNNDRKIGFNYTFGQRPFTYTAPSGFLPLNTFNI